MSSGWRWKRPLAPSALTKCSGCISPFLTACRQWFRPEAGTLATEQLLQPCPVTLLSHRTNLSGGCNMLAMHVALGKKIASGGVWKLTQHCCMKINASCCIFLLFRIMCSDQGLHFFSPSHYWIICSSLGMRTLCYYSFKAVARVLPWSYLM